MSNMASTDMLDRPGARLTFDVRGAGPLLVFAGSPMGADGFAAIAARLTVDHTVLTFDPRGIGRSPVDDPDASSPVPGRAADLAALIEHVGGGPATLFGSSGGAVVSLALTQQHPDLVAAVVAHEPPLDGLLPEGDRRLGGADRIARIYREQGPAAAWEVFLEAAGMPTADPDAGEGGSGLPGADESADDGPDPARMAADQRHFFLNEMVETEAWLPDLDVLRGRPIAVGVGEQSTGQLCDDTSRALADGLGLERDRFPGGHVGFLTNPTAFEPALRAVLARF